MTLRNKLKALYWTIESGFALIGLAVVIKRHPVKARFCWRWAKILWRK